MPLGRTANCGACNYCSDCGHCGHCAKLVGMCGVYRWLWHASAERAEVLKDAGGDAGEQGENDGEHGEPSLWCQVGP